MEYQRQDPTTNELGELELLEANLRLWEDLSDEAFERHFRQPHFGEEPLTRSDAIARLKGRLHTLTALSQEGKLEGDSEQTDPLSLDPLSISLPSEPVDEAASSFPDLQFLELVGPYRPVRSLLTSTVLHLIIICLISVLRFTPKRNSLIDFEKDKITYYQVNAHFPSIVPSEAPVKSVQAEASSAENKIPEAKIPEAETRIHPEIQKPVEMIIEQPEMSSVDLLPKLVLPNILLKSAKAEPGKAPVALEKPRFTILDEPALTQPVEVQPQALNSESAIALKPKLALPSQPLPAVPVIEEPKGEVQEGGLHTASGSDLLVYSNQPALPKGELAVPKVNAVGRMVSPSHAKTPAGTEELGKADIVIPAISIKNQTPALSSGAGVAVIQAPIPPKPEEKKKQPKLSASRDRLPSLLMGIQPAKLELNLPPDVTSSPLREMERQGKTIYTTSMNSPNFTSKRGNWIFRFAELPNESVNSDPKATPPDPNETDAPLSAPSATVKVDPKYPPEVIREKVEGHVILYAVLRKDGIIDPATVRIIQKLDPRLDISARDALIGWKFKPSLKSGLPVEIQAEITIPFYFRDDWFKH